MPASVFTTLMSSLSSRGGETGWGHGQSSVSHHNHYPIKTFPSSSSRLPYLLQYSPSTDFRPQGGFMGIENYSQSVSEGDLSVCDWKHLAGPGSPIVDGSEITNLKTGSISQPSADRKSCQNSFRGKEVPLPDSSNPFNVSLLHIYFLLTLTEQDYGQTKSCGYKICTLWEPVINMWEQDQ